MTPCQSYTHPRLKKMRWVATSQGIVTDIALRPLTDDTYPLIEKLTLEIDAAIKKARQPSLEPSTGQ